MTDLTLISRQLPARGARAESVARMLDQLAEEVREAASAIRDSAP